MNTAATQSSSSDALSHEAFIALKRAARAGDAVEIPGGASAFQVEVLTDAMKDAASVRKNAAKVEAARLGREAATAAKVARAATIAAGSATCSCCGAAVKVVRGVLARHGQRGGVNGSTGPMATGMRVSGRQTAACDGSGKAA